MDNVVFGLGFAAEQTLNLLRDKLWNVIPVLLVLAIVASVTTGSTAFLVIATATAVIWGLLSRSKATHAARTAEFTRRRVEAMRQERERQDAILREAAEKAIADGALTRQDFLTLRDKMQFQSFNTVWGTR